MPLRKLAFIGERDAPDVVSSVQARRPLLGTGKPPSALVDVARNHSIYVAASGTKKPNVDIQRIKGEKSLWRVDVPIGDDLQGARPGRSLNRVPRDQVLKETDEGVSFGSFRPDWMDALYVPRQSVAVDRQVMRRFSGRRVRPTWVFGRDDRWEFRDPAWPWGLVGKIFTNQGLMGSGALVGDRLVVTAGHMVPWNSGAWWMRFVPAFYDGVSLQGDGVQSYVSDAYGYDVGGDVTGYDWAILRLYEPLGSWFGYFGYNGYSEDWNDGAYWSIIGYPGAIAGGYRPSFQGGITVSDVDGDSNGGQELESDSADVTPGDSGGPIFGWWGGDPRLVGVVSGEEEYDFLGWTFDQDNIMSSGSGFTSIVAWGRTNWPA